MNNDDIVLYKSSKKTNRNLIDMFKNKYKKIDVDQYMKYPLSIEKKSNFKGVITESTGQEPNRCVVIKPVEK